MESQRRRPSLHPPVWRERPERRRLLALYAEADALIAGLSCDASTDCCRFGVTGREPYVTQAEVAEIEDAIRARGSRPAIRSRKLDIANERRCPMLSDAGKCMVYASRPLGCRTFFCAPALAKLGAKLPRAELQRIAGDIEAVSRKAFSGEPGSRPLTRALSSR